jgi:hypothetical protein
VPGFAIRVEFASGEFTVTVDRVALGPGQPGAGTRRFS